MTDPCAIHGGHWYVCGECGGWRARCTRAFCRAANPNVGTDQLSDGVWREPCKCERAVDVGEREAPPGEWVDGDYVF